MRDWHLTADSPLSMRFAADVRLGRTNYADDQSWEIAFGNGQEPALNFQTRYGGRAGLVRLVPMWVIDSSPVYETSAFAEKPVLRAFAPNYAKITARPLSTLALTAELWVMESQAVGGCFTLENTSNAPVTLRLELFAQVVREGSMVDMNLLGLDDNSEALHLGMVGNLNPILLLEHATASGTVPGEHVSPKLSAPISIAPGATASIRWVHAGRPSLNDSLQSAFKWLYQTDWNEAFQAVERVNTNTPIIETGNADWDAAIAFSQQVVLRSFVGPTGNLPYPSFVTARIPSRGFSPYGDGSDYSGQWGGQTAALDYLALPAVAILAPDLARGAIRNALAVKQADGWIDFKPGLGGQRSNVLSMPLLATTAWRIYELTEDRDFIAEVYASLSQFFERWFQHDMDRDGDGLPEWSITAQSGYPDNPMFARYRRWAQNADISKAETPDLAAYLVCEANSLLQMATLLDNKDTASIRARLDKLLAHLDALWDDKTGRYVCRDRDTHHTPVGTLLFQGKADESFDARPRLDPPNRLILRVIGGKDHAPRVTATVEGIDSNGKSVAETLPTSAFIWHYGLGAAVSEHAYSQVNYVKFEGLSRVFSVEVSTVDLTRQNQTLLTPLWAEVGGEERALQLAKLITDPARYWRPFGMPVCPADDPAFAPNNDGGSGGVWLLWNTMLIEALLAGPAEVGFTLFSHILAAQIKALRHDHGFREAYNSDTGDGIGDLDELAGVVPLQLVMELIGLRIINQRRVWAGRWFAFPDPIKVTQNGVEVTRSKEGTTVHFPSGHVAQVGPDWQLIEDPTPAPVRIETAPQVEVVPSSETTATVVVIDTPMTASIIPVDTKKDDTLEIPISQIDFGAQSSDPDISGMVKIPVRGPEGDE